MAGYNQYRRRWSTNIPPTRSRAAIVGRGIGIFSALLALAVVLYIFGVIGGDTHYHSASDAPTAVSALVPPPALLVVPTPIGPSQPFGTLPSVQPFANVPPGLTFSYQLSGPLSGGGGSADVFRLAWTKPTAMQVDALARKLGLTGPVREMKTGGYTVDGNGKLSVDGRTTVYDPATPLPSTMPPPTDDRAAVVSARSWLLSRDLLPMDVGAVDVQYTAGAVDVVFHPKNLPDLLSSIPGVRIHMQSDGAVTEMKRMWPTQLTPGAYDLISLDTAWAAVAQRGMPDVRLPLDTTLPPDAVAQTIIDNVSISYAYAGGTSADYLQPVYVFNGHATITGITTSLPVRVAVPAVRDTTLPAR